MTDSASSRLVEHAGPAIRRRLAARGRSRRPQRAALPLPGLLVVVLVLISRMQTGGGAPMQPSPATFRVPIIPQGRHGRRGS